MTQALDQSILELLRASRDDEQALGFPVSDRTFGFHAQQAAEKLLKALIGAHGEQYQFTHDLGRLIRHVGSLHEQLPVATADLENLTDYAGVWRYQDSDALTVGERADIKALVVAVREYAFLRIAILRPGVDWKAAL